jgi:RNA polymerase sigma factor (sigma-70 family)
LAQEIWLKLWKSTQTHENSIRDFKSYLYRTVQTTLWETVQQLDKRPEVALEDQLVEPSEASPEKAILRKALLEKRMKQLKPQEQELMQLHFTGMTYKEIALLMRLEPGRVRNLLTRVKRKLEANDAS